MKRKARVYLVTLIDEGVTRYYVGKTVKTSEQRWKEHVRVAQKKPWFTSFLLNAIRKHGEDKFTVKTVAEFETEKEAFSEERRLIRELRDSGVSVMNLSDGGEGNAGWHHLPDVCKRIGEALRGRTIPEAQRKKISASLMGHPVATHVRKAVSEASRARKGRFSISTIEKHREHGKKQAEEGHLKKMTGRRWLIERILAKECERCRSRRDELKHLSNEELEILNGGSDAIVYPTHTKFILETLKTELLVSKGIAWVGLQHPYPPQRSIAEAHPRLRHGFFDIVSDEAPDCFKLDINAGGWGDSLKRDGFDVMTLFRVTFYALDHDAFIRELEAFVSDGGIVVFEDCQPTAQGQEENKYRGVSCFKTNEPFTREKLERHFSVSDWKRDTLPDGRWFDMSVLRKK